MTRSTKITPLLVDENSHDPQITELSSITVFNSKEEKTELDGKKNKPIAIHSALPKDILLKVLDFCHTTAGINFTLALSSYGKKFLEIYCGTPENVEKMAFQALKNVAPSLLNDIEAEASEIEREGKKLVKYLKSLFCITGTGGLTGTGYCFYWMYQYLSVAQMTAAVVTMITLTVLLGCISSLLLFLAYAMYFKVGAFQHLEVNFFKLTFLENDSENSILYRRMINHFQANANTLAEMYNQIEAFIERSSLSQTIKKHSCIFFRHAVATNNSDNSSMPNEAESNSMSLTS